MLNSKNSVFNPFFLNRCLSNEKNTFADNSRVEPTIFLMEKLSFSFKLLSGDFYGQSFIKTVRGPSDVRVFLNEKEVENLDVAARLADDYSLTHKTSFVNKPFPRKPFNPQLKFTPQSRPFIPQSKPHFPQSGPKSNPSNPSDNSSHSFTPKP